MKLERTGFSDARRLMRDDGTMAGLVMQYTTGTWRVHVDEHAVSPLFLTPNQALKWAKEHMK